MKQQKTVCIVGAGMAGISAALELQKRAYGVVLLEARESIGGRARTTHEADWPLPIELGAEFVHGPAEPLMSLVKSAGVGLQEITDRHVQTTAHGRFVDMGNTWERFAHMFQDLDDDAEGSAEDFLRRGGLDKGNAELFQHMVEGFDAAPLDDISLKSVVAEARSVAADSAQFRPGGGYGALVDRLAGELDPECVKLSTNATVESIFHQSRGPCRVGVGFSDGHEELTADYCLVTAPIGVLQAVSGPGAIRFTPELDPNEKPWEEFGMGQVTKVVLAFHAPRWQKNLPDADFIHDFGALFPTWWQRSASGLLLLTAWAGGPKAKTVAAYGDRDIVDLAITEMARMLGLTALDIRQSLVGAFHHDFSRDPFSRGAYPYVRPGGSSLVEALAKPVDGTLFFAGDATDSAHFATVPGALASGIRAASEIMQAA